MSQVIIDFNLHQAQRTIFNDPRRFRVSCSGRRFGKTALATWELLIRALSFPGKPSITSPEMVLGILPTANQARQILWKPLVNICESEAFKPLVKDINRTNMTIELHGKPSIRVVGANDQGGDRLRGLRIYFAVLDEIQDINPAAFWDVCRPAMSDTPGSRALFTGTPKGRRGILWEMSKLPEQDPDWVFYHYPSSANPTIPRAEIENARLTLPPRLFAQEFNASFEDFPGKYYTELDHLNRYSGDIKDLPPFDLSLLGIDFGDCHPALVVINRGTDRNYYLTECWNPNQGKEPQPIPNHVFYGHIRRLVKKWNIKLILADPSRPSDILAIRGLGADAGYHNAKAGYNKIAEGISQVHNLIAQNRLIFVPGMSDPVEGAMDADLAYMLVEAYHRIKNKDGSFSDEPADGYEAHVNDAIRYALAIRSGSN